MANDLDRDPPVHDPSVVFKLEYSAPKSLIDAEQRMRDADVSIRLSGLMPEVFAMVQRSSLGRQRTTLNLATAVAKYLANCPEIPRLEP
jgi:SulP family sulfate permease